jgi:preprotein translocase subunit SecG
MEIYMDIIEDILAVTLIVLVLVQSKGGGLGAVFGGDTIYKTRRGVEKTVFQATIGVAIVFFAIALLNVVLQK